MGQSNDELYAMRHSAAHVLASAVQHLYANAQFGVGPVVENGFYYDIDLGDKLLSDEDLSAIEKEMQKIVGANQSFEKSVIPIDEAIKWAQEANQPYKAELLNDLKRAGTTTAKDIDQAELGTVAKGDSKVEEVSFYTNGDFKDLCRGPHVETTGKIGPFKLLRVSGAYWRGNEQNKQLQRVYGVAFSSKQALEGYLNSLEEAKKRDHRKLGQELDLFVHSDLVGPGLPLFTPRGTILRQELIRYSEELQIAGGYQAVWVPHMARVQLYKKSGHYDKYPERFDVSSAESTDKFMLKPMNCPHVVQIYLSRPRSYRELPMRYMETTTMYRDEKSGELHGLSRVRSITQDDSHAFVRHDQIEADMRSIILMAKKMYETLDLPLTVDLSFRDDSDKYFGDKKVWDDAQNIIEKVAKEEGLDYVVSLGEAAFYGPKIDMHVSDALGRKWQTVTVQLDFVMPERFDLDYTTAKGDKNRPAMIHKTILGSIERFLSVYIEHTAGKFPVWLAPEQIRILTLNQDDEIVKFAYDLAEQAKAAGLRATVDDENESVSKKIRNAEVMKVPYVVVVGRKEVDSQSVMPRVRQDLLDKDRQAGLVSLEEFVSKVKQEYADRAIKSSF